MTDTRLRDLFPLFKTTGEALCWHGDREGSTLCHACGHTTPKGPKQPKRWVWAKGP